MVDSFDLGLNKRLETGGDTISQLRSNMTQIIRVFGKGNGCKHRDVLGVSYIDDIEVGLCVNCRKVINNSKGFCVNRETAFKWMSEHPMEIVNFKLWEI